MIASFLKYMLLELNRSGHTAEAYGRDLREFAAHLGEDPEAFIGGRVSSADIRGWLAALAREGVSPRSLRRKTQALRAYFRWLMKRGEVGSNPAAEVQLAKIGKKLPEFVREQEMEDILDTPAPGGDPALRMRNHLILNLLYSMGIRQEELLRITDADISEYAKEIRVTGKRDKTRVIPVADELIEEIKQWQKVRDSLYDLPKPAPLICSARGGLSKAGLYKIVHEELLPTNATHKSPHSLRHTFATSLLNGGAEINSVKELLGHASLQSTQIYTHLSFADLRKAYDSAHPRAAGDGHGSDDGQKR